MQDFPFPQPAPGFDDPLGLLRACHMRMLMHCSTLERLPAQLGNPDNAEANRQAVEKIRHYFNTAAHLHHEDEEKDLFPLLMQCDAGLNTAVCELSSEHPQLEAAWQALDAQLADLDAITDADALDETIRAFTNAYRQHIQKEEQTVLMPGGALLDEQQLKQLGRAIARRRNVDESNWPDALK